MSLDIGGSFPYRCRDGSVIYRHHKWTASEFERLRELMGDVVVFAEVTDDKILNPSFDKEKYYRECDELQSKMLNPKQGEENGTNTD